ncbi:MAG: hypothetical protein ACN23H_01495 [Candidatus Phytoplasma vitis]
MKKMFYKEKIKQPGFLVKLGCLMCIIPLTIVIIVGIILTIVSLYYLFGTTTMFNNIKTYLGYGFLIIIYLYLLLLLVISYLFNYVYIKIFQGKASDKVRMVFGIMSLPFAGLCILFGDYKDINK